MGDASDESRRTAGICGDEGPAARTIDGILRNVASNTKASAPRSLTRS
jgi:hypothetical protein